MLTGALTNGWAVDFAPEQRWKVVLGPWILGTLCLQGEPADKGTWKLLGTVQGAAWLDRLAGKKLIETRLESVVQENPWRSLEYQQTRQEINYTTTTRRLLDYEKREGLLMAAAKDGKPRQERFELEGNSYQDPVSFLWGIARGGLNPSESPVHILETKRVVSLMPSQKKGVTPAILFQETRESPGLKKELECFYDRDQSFAGLKASLGPLIVWVVPLAKISGSGRQALYAIVGGFLAGFFLLVGLDRRKEHQQGWKALLQRCLGFGGLVLLLVLWLGTETILPPEGPALFWLTLSFLATVCILLQRPRRRLLDR